MIFEVKHDRLLISFSGGKTSAYMTKRLLGEYRKYWSEIVVAFANTGQEDPKTLEYVNNCDREFGFGVVWLEAVFNPIPGEGTTHRVVSFETADRSGEPFESMVKKHGLPNSQFPHCTRELKVRALRSYLRSLGWAASSYNTAIGLRFDELVRMSPKDMVKGVFYPCIQWEITVEEVQEWDARQRVRLGLPEHRGNCIWCWKKSFRKLATVAKESPQDFDFPAYLEKTYPDHGPGFGDRRIFRSRKTVADIVAMAADPSFEPFVDSFKYGESEMDSGMACGDSCEIGVDGPGLDDEISEVI